MMSTKEEDFPSLAGCDWQQTSDPDPTYNCIAYAAGRTDVYWWPDDYPEPESDYWPAAIPREETLSAFSHLFQSLGYEICDDGDFELSYEKVTIYAKGDSPTHVARQLENGEWTSKLGPLEDIRHASPAALAGPCYGEPVRYLRRRRT